MANTGREAVAGSPGCSRPAVVGKGFRRHSEGKGFRRHLEGKGCLAEGGNRIHDSRGADRQVAGSTLQGRAMEVLREGVPRSLQEVAPKCLRRTKHYSLRRIE